MQQNAFPQPPQSQPSIPPNLAAIISQLTSQNQQNAQAQSQPQQQQNQIYEDPERKRLREMSAGYDGANDDRYGQAKRSKVNGDAKQKKHVSDVLPQTAMMRLTSCYSQRLASSLVDTGGRGNVWRVMIVHSVMIPWTETLSNWHHELLIWYPESSNDQPGTVVLKSNVDCYFPTVSIIKNILFFSIQFGHRLWSCISFSVLGTV